MPEDLCLTPAPVNDVRDTLAFALRFGRKCAHTADELMTRITAERLVKDLEQWISWSRAYRPSATCHGCRAAPRPRPRATVAANASARGHRRAVLESPLADFTGWLLAVDCGAPQCRRDRVYALAELAGMVGRQTTAGALLRRLR